MSNSWRGHHIWCWRKNEHCVTLPAQKNYIAPADTASCVYSDKLEGQTIFLGGEVMPYTNVIWQTSNYFMRDSYHSLSDY